MQQVVLSEKFLHTRTHCSLKTLTTIIALHHGDMPWTAKNIEKTMKLKNEQSYSNV